MKRDVFLGRFQLLCQIVLHFLLSSLWLVCVIFIGYTEWFIDILFKWKFEWQCFPLDMDKKLFEQGHFAIFILLVLDIVITFVVAPRKHSRNQAIVMLVLFAIGFFSEVLTEYKFGVYAILVALSCVFLIKFLSICSIAGKSNIIEVGKR